MSVPLAARIAKTLGARLRMARQAHGLTLAQVAAALDSHAPVVSRTESGHFLPELAHAVRHAHAVGLTLADVGAVLDDVLADGGPR